MARLRVGIEIWLKKKPVPSSRHEVVNGRHHLHVEAYRYFDPARLAIGACLIDLRVIRHGGHTFELLVQQSAHVGVQTVH